MCTDTKGFSLRAIEFPGAVAMPRGTFSILIATLKILDHASDFDALGGRIGFISRNQKIRDPRVYFNKQPP